MLAGDKWRSVGWRHTTWDLVRFYCSIRGSNKQKAWLDDLRASCSMKVGAGDEFPIPAEDVELFLNYLDARAAQREEGLALLRTEDEALAFCEAQGIGVGTTRTRNKDHHQSSKALIAAVSAIGEQVAAENGLAIDANPQTRSVWCTDKALHVTARNLDGAIPGLSNPKVIWEIKEYWGSTGGGSKMSDAVYECALVGRELREFEERSDVSVSHVVFVDGRDQWLTRKSDLARFVDLLNQGLIDFLFVGREVETEWGPTLTRLLA